MTEQRGRPLIDVLFEDEMPKKKSEKFRGLTPNKDLPRCKNCDRQMPERTTSHHFMQGEQVRTIEEACRKAGCDQSLLTLVEWRPAEKQVTYRECWPDNPNMWQGHGPDELAGYRAGSDLGYLVVWSVRWATRTYGYLGNGDFCTMACGYNFGKSAVKAGYRKRFKQPE
jgi:hypothetical protein